MPAVANPLDLAGYDPCDLLALGDLGVIGYGQEADATALTDECQYTDDVRAGALMVKLFLEESPLSAAYERNAASCEKFEPREILNYPAVVEAEKVADGTCVVRIGTADDQGVVLVKYPDQGADPADHDAACGLLTLLSETVLHNLGV